MRGRDQNCLICMLKICEDPQIFTASVHNGQFYLKETCCALMFFKNVAEKQKRGYIFLNLTSHNIHFSFLISRMFIFSIQ